MVSDEGRTHRAHDAIRAWSHEARSRFDYAVEPSGVTRDGERVTVNANVVGNFPGSAVQLEHVFELAEGRIGSLEIG